MFEKFKSMKDDLAEIEYKIERNNSIINTIKNITSSETCTIPAISGTCSVTINKNAWNNVITAWAPPEPPEPKLNMISCPCCGQGEVRKTKIDGIVECIYCNRQFTLSY